MRNSTAATTTAAFAAGRYVRGFNLHSTPRSDAARLEARLADLAGRYAPVSEDDLLAAFASGGWDTPRPGLVVALYNGHRDNAEVAAPVLERLGLVGWFFLPTGYLDAPAAEQSAYAAAHRLGEPPDLHSGERAAMSWDEARALAERGHVIASHTRTHAALDGLGQEAVDAEVLGSRTVLEARLGRPVRTLAVLGGHGAGALPALDDAIARAGYVLVFANHAIQRVGPPGP